MPNAPAAPTRQYSFTDHAVYQPAVPRPGDKIDAELDRINTALAQVMLWVKTSVADNGTLLPGALSIASLDQATVDVINGSAADAAAARDEAEAAKVAASNSQLAATAAASQATAAVNDADAAVVAASNSQAAASASANQAADSRIAAEAAAAAAETAKNAATTDATTAATNSAASAAAAATDASNAQAAATASAASAASADNRATASAVAANEANNKATTAQTAATEAAASAQAAEDTLAASSAASKYVDLHQHWEPTMSAGQVIMRRVIPRAMTFAAGASGRGRSANVAAGTAVLNIQRNGVTIGTITWSGGQIGTVSFSSAAAMAIGDLLTVVGPASPDAGLSTLAIVLTATYA